MWPAVGLALCAAFVCVGGGGQEGRGPQAEATCALRARCAQPLKGSSQAKDRFPKAVRGSPQFPLLLSHCVPRGLYVTCASRVAFMSKSTEPTVRWLQWCHRAPETPQPHHPRTGKWPPFGQLRMIPLSSVGPGSICGGHCWGHSSPASVPSLGGACSDQEPGESRSTGQK